MIAPIVIPYHNDLVLSEHPYLRLCHWRTVFTSLVRIHKETSDISGEQAAATELRKIEAEIKRRSST